LKNQLKILGTKISISKTKITFTFALLFTLSGYSTSYYITTKPSGADVTLMNRPQGATPLSIQYSNTWKKSGALTIKKEAIVKSERIKFNC